MPTNLRRLAAFKRTASATDGIIIQLSDNAAIKVSQDTLDRYTAAQLQAVICTVAERTDIHFHRNRDGSVAVAIGNAPQTWPEDEVA